MKPLIDELIKVINTFTHSEGFNTTPLHEVTCLKISSTDVRSKRLWQARFAIIAQGRKDIVLGTQIFRAREAHYSITPVNLPVSSRVASASSDKPLLGILIELSPLLLTEVIKLFDEERSTSTSDSGRALFMGEADEKMLEACIRLMKLFNSPGDVKALGPLIIREILYHALKGTSGEPIRRFVQAGNKSYQLSQAIHSIQSDISQEIDIHKLLKVSGMGRSAFFKAFKEATSMSPIQYQKRLRLLEAKRLMLQERESAEGACYRVGYKSASQFGREYTRMFGASPRKDTIKNT